jgi:putative sigma-54 modulation protein
MRLEITGRQIPITPAARRLVEQRIAHTVKLLQGSVMSTHVVLAKLRGRVRAEVTVHVSREHILHGEGAGSDVQAALTAATDKIEHQAEKLKGRWAGRKRRESASRGEAMPGRGPSAVDGASARTSEDRGRRIIRARRYAVKPMSIEDAAAEIGDGSDAVIVFRNSSTDAVTVLFRRADGHLGLIEPEA